MVKVVYALDLSYNKNSIFNYRTGLALFYFTPRTVLNSILQQKAAICFKFNLYIYSGHVHFYVGDDVGIDKCFPFGIIKLSTDNNPSIHLYTANIRESAGSRTQMQRWRGILNNKRKQT